MPPEFVALMFLFQPLFSTRAYGHALTLVAGAMLTPGARTVTNALRIMGLEHQAPFQDYHRLLNRARWSLHQTSQRISS